MVDCTLASGPRQTVDLFRQESLDNFLGPSCLSNPFFPIDLSSGSDGSAASPPQLLIRRESLDHLWGLSCFLDFPQGLPFSR